MKYSLSSAALTAATLINSATAFWRMPCQAPVAIERLDPIINPGAVSGHMHFVTGGTAFNANLTYEETQGADVESACVVTADRSNYWVPQLYFWDSSAEEGQQFTAIPDNGGALVYYLQRYNSNTDTKLTAFPKGFRMLAGDHMRRSFDQNSLADRAVNYVCLGKDYEYNIANFSFPARTCDFGFRQQLIFPSCWDGVNLFLPGSAHMAYPDGVDNGVCPSSHPVRTVTLFYEVTWEVANFADRFESASAANAQWAAKNNFTYPDGQAHPYIWSTGDPTGYGSHGDFFMGWDTEVLQNAIDTCTAQSGQIEDCPVFSSYMQDYGVAGTKRARPQVQEDWMGPFGSLPGNNPVDFTGSMMDMGDVPQAPLLFNEPPMGNITFNSVPAPSPSASGDCSVVYVTVTVTPTADSSMDMGDMSTSSAMNMGDMTTSSAMNMGDMTTSSAMNMGDMTTSSAMNMGDMTTSSAMNMGGMSM